jgi:hypothetical protein
MVNAVTRVVFLILFMSQSRAVGLEISQLQQKIYSNTIHITLGNSEKGCTGFHVNIPAFPKPVIATNLHCVVYARKLESMLMESEVVFDDVKVQQPGSLKKISTSVVGYHPKADLVILESPFGSNAKGLSLFESEIDVNSKVFSMRYDWKNPEDRISFLEAEILALRSEHGDQKMSHIYHRGQTMLNGYSGSPLVNQNGDVVGINFYSFNPFFNLAAHRDVFDSLFQFQQKLNVGDFIKKYMGLNQIVQSDLFSQFSIQTPDFLSTKVENAAYSYQVQQNRSFVLLEVSSFLFDSYLSRILPRITSDIDEKEKNQFGKIFTLAEDALKKLKERLNISSMKAMLDCSKSKVWLQYIKKTQDRGATDRENNEVVQVCEKYIYFLSLEKENFDRLNEAGESKITFQKMIGNEREDLAEFR